MNSVRAGRPLTLKFVGFVKSFDRIFLYLFEMPFSFVIESCRNVTQSAGELCVERGGVHLCNNDPFTLPYICCVYR